MKKKNLFCIVIILIASFLMSSCGPSKKLATKEPQTQIDSTKQTVNLRPQNMVLWRASMREGLTTKEVAYFYNNYEILLKGSIPKYHDLLLDKEGGFVNQDSVIYIERIIPAFTSGRVIDIGRDKNGVMIKMTIRFDVGDDSFKILYTMEDYARWKESEDSRGQIRKPILETKSFILNANAKIIYFGNEANVIAKVGTTDDDRLLVKLTGDTTPITSKKIAKGMAGASGATDTQPATPTQKGNIPQNSTTPQSGYEPPK